MSLKEFLMMLPDDVKNHIFEYNPMHRQNMKKSLETIAPLALEKRIGYLIDLYERKWPIYDSFQSVCEKYIDDPEIFLEHYSNCTCCPRHQKNRPKHLWHSWATMDNYPRMNTDEPGEIPCHCKCRHVCRQIVMRSFE